MYVGRHVCMHVHTTHITYIHAYMHVYVHMHLLIPVHRQMHMGIYVCMYVDKYAYYTYICIDACMCIYLSCMNVYLYVNDMSVNMHACMHI